VAGAPAQLPDVAVNSFVSSLSRQPWFAAVGEPLTESECGDAQEYLRLLGFATAETRSVPTWQAAEKIIRDPHWDKRWWDAEEKLRLQLLGPLIATWGEHTVMSRLTQVTDEATRVTLGAASVAAARANLADPALTRAASGAATQACYQALLTEIAGIDEDHSFRAKFRLFAAGRWPLGLVGDALRVLTRQKTSLKNRRRPEFMGPEFHDIAAKTGRRRPEESS